MSHQTLEEARCNHPNHHHLAARVSVSAHHRERLASGLIPCPVCSTHCKPVLVRIAPSEWPNWLVQVSGWREESAAWVEVVHYYVEQPLGRWAG